MTPLHTERLIIRNWEERDRGVFHEINSDERVMAFFNFRRSRTEADAAMDALMNEIASTGFGKPAIELRASGECLGSCGLSMPNLAPALPALTVEIGWRLAARHWGHGYVTEAAKALLADGFARRGFPEIVSFTVPANRRSIAVMQRIGMERDYSADFDHPHTPASHPHFKRQIVYRLTKRQWKNAAG